MILYVVTVTTWDSRDHVYREHVVRFLRRRKLTTQGTERAVRRIVGPAHVHRIETFLVTR